MKSYRLLLGLLILAVSFNCENKIFDSNDRPGYCDIYGNIQYVQEDEDYTFSWTMDDEKADLFIKWTLEEKNSEGYWRNRTIDNKGIKLKNITLSSAEPDFYVKNITLSDKEPGCK